MAVLRNRIGLLEDRFFATVFLGSGLLFVAMLFAAVAVARGLLDTFGTGTRLPGESEAFRVGRGMAFALMNTFGTRMAAVFMFVTSTIGLRTAVLSRWVSFVGFGLGLVLLLVITDFAWIALLFPLWVLLVSTYILYSDFQKERYTANRRPRGRREARGHPLRDAVRIRLRRAARRARFAWIRSAWGPAPSPLTPLPQGRGGPKKRGRRALDSPLPAGAGGPKKMRTSARDSPQASRVPRISIAVHEISPGEANPVGCTSMCLSTLPRWISCMVTHASGRFDFGSAVPSNVPSKRAWR